MVIHKDFQAVRKLVNGHPALAGGDFRHFIRENALKLLTSKKTVGVSVKAETDIEQALQGNVGESADGKVYFVVQLGSVQAIVLEQFGHWFVSHKYYIKGKNGKHSLHDIYGN